MNIALRSHVFHSLLRAMILYGFGMLFLSLIVTGNLQNYIGPKMNPLFYTATVTFFLLSIVQIIRSLLGVQAKAIPCNCGTVHQPKGSLLTKIIIYGIFIIPVLSGFILPHKVLDSAVAEKRGVQLSLGTPTQSRSPSSATISISSNSNNNAPKGNESKSSKTETAVSNPNEDVFSAAGFGDYYANMARNLYKQDVIQLNDKSYLENLTVINLFLPQFVGKKIELKGFVYRGEDTNLTKDQLVIARFAITCCTADASVAGVLAQGDMTKNYPPNTWVDIQGTIQKEELKSTAVPMIQLDHVNKIKPPKNPYVY